MAVAFYIPDQELLLRKSKEKEKEILKKRETQWKFIAMVLLDALKRYVAATSASKCKHCRGAKN